MADATSPQGEEAAFRAGLIEILPHLRAFARGLCGQAAEADDLVQETAAKAWAARARFEQGSSLRAWTFTILRNQFLNQVRKRRFEAEIGETGIENALVDREAQEDGLLMDDLQHALDRLPPERREALLLVGASGFSYEEAASICGIPVGTMKSRVARGRAMLAEILREREAG